MSTPMMSQFLEGLHASRLLDNERIDEVLRRPEAPQGDVDGVARFLEGQGWLTRFQIDEIRQGRGQTLLFAGYRMLDRLPDHPGGATFRAHHPALQQAVVVRLLNIEWVQPADDLRSYLDRARNASLVSHLNLVNTLDAGFAGETPFLVSEFVDGAPLSYFIGEMGPLPVSLACEYIRQAATGVQAAHERGVLHGDLSPSRLMLSPVIRKMGTNGDGKPASIRPAPNSTVKVEGMGLIPQRPPAVQVPPTDIHLLGAFRFMAPERVSSSTFDVRGDIYSLGATLYYLLAGRPPYSAESPGDVLLHIQQGEPARIDSLRRDVTPLLADLIHRLMAKDPSLRPSSAASVAQYLMPFCQINAPAAPKPATDAVPVASETDTRPNSLPNVMAQGKDVPPMAYVLDNPVFEPLPENTSDSQVYGSSGQRGANNTIPEGEHHDMFAEQHGDSSEPRAPRMSDKQVKKGWTWLIIGLCLHLTAVTALVLYFFKLGPFEEEPAPNPKQLPR